MSFLRLVGYVIVVIVFNLAGLVFVCFLESRRVQREGGSSILASLWHALVGLLKFIIAIALIVIAICSFNYWNSSTQSKNTNPAQAKSTQKPKSIQKSSQNNHQIPIDPLEKLSSSELRAMWEINAHNPELRQKIDNILNNRARKSKK